MRKGLVGLLALAAVVAACGGDDTGGEGAADAGPFDPG